MLLLSHVCFENKEVFLLKIMFILANKFMTKLHFILSGQPLLSGHFPVHRGWLLSGGSTVLGALIQISRLSACFSY